jgi:hypothetical protein
VTALLCAAVAIILLITPTIAHRLRWRQQDKNALLVLATRTSIAATVFIATAMSTAIFLIFDLLFGTLAPALVTAGVGLLFAWFWYGFPLLRRLRDRAPR